MEILHLKTVSNENSIGFFDSGVGGLTIFQEVVKQLPHENLVYLGDTANFPYGNKSPEDILRFSQENADFLLSKNIKLLVIPCYTASSHAYESLQRTLSIPVITVAKSGIEQLAVSTQTNSVAILGTTRTIESGFLQTQLLAINPLLQIQAIACPLFASFVEEGLHNHPILRQIAKHYLAPLKKAAVDCALLACTHYSFLTPIIQETLGPNVQLISPASYCAKEITNFLDKAKMLNPSRETPKHTFYVTAHSPNFHDQAKIFIPNMTASVFKTVSVKN